MHEGICLLDVLPVDDGRDRGAVRGREVARRRLEGERRGDQAPERQSTREPGDGNGDERRAAHEVGTDHQPPAAPAVGGDPAVQPEDEGRQAVGQPHGHDAERTAAVEGEPHQGDVVERVADLARRDGAEEEPEVTAPQEPERRGASGPRELALARQVEHGIGHRPSVIYA